MSTFNDSDEIGTFINSKKMTPFELAVVLDAVFDCIKTASSFGGKVYGGFVRDVIVPRIHNPSCFVKFKDVDIWFTSQSASEAFIAAMNPLFFKSSGISVKEDRYPGAFKRDQYHIRNYSAILAWIDVIVSDKLPVNDFDVNEVTYSLIDGSWVTDAPPRLINQIQKKQAIMMLSYHELIQDANNIKSGDARFNPRSKLYYSLRIKRIFTDKGWTVFVPMIGYTTA